MMVIRDLDDGRRLLDAASLGHCAHVPTKTIKRKIQPVACDWHTRTNLYDFDASMPIARGIKTRATRQTASYALP